MDTSNRPKANAENSRTHTGSTSGCCGGPAPGGTSACCAEDAAVKSTAERGVDAALRRGETRPRSLPAVSSK